jgi:hypothetical protein
MFCSPLCAPLRSVRLAVTALALTLASLPAGAIVVQEGKTPEDTARRLAEAHAEGRKHPNVVGLQAIGLEGELVEGTGVFLGLDDKGQTGFVLTASHLFRELGQKPGSRAFLGVMVTFGPRNGSTQGAGCHRVAANRIYIHPDREEFADRLERDGRISESPAIRHDVAVLAFPAEGCGKALDRLGVKPAALFDEEIPRAPLTAARIAGFGLSGTHGDVMLQATGRIHAGDQLVTFGRYRGLDAFMQWHVYPDSIVLNWSKSTWYGEAFNRSAFQPMAETQSFTTPCLPEPVQVRTLPRECSAAVGDSGGPLFLVNKAGEQAVAGILNYRRYDYSTGADGRKRILTVMLAEPVKDHLPFIRSIQEGQPGKAEVIEAGPVASLEALEKLVQAIHPRGLPDEDDGDGAAETKAAGTETKGAAASSGQAPAAGTAAAAAVETKGPAGAAPKED